MAINNGGKIAFQALLDKINKLFDEQGILPWSKGWTSLHPQSVRGYEYRGTNVLMCQTQAMIEGFGDPRWITKKECLKRGGRIKEDQFKNNVLIIHWSWRHRKKEVEDEETGEKEIEHYSYPSVSFHAEWNVAQCEGLELKAFELPGKDLETVEEAQSIVDTYCQAKGPSIQYGEGYNPVYYPSKDRVCCPPLESFHNEMEFYLAQFHECAHSTGHPKRLHRFETGAAFNPFGSKDYGKEELVAEIAASMLCDHVGLDASHINSTASYLKGWLKRINEEITLLPWAAQEAQKAVDLILNGQLPQYSKDDAPSATKQDWS